MNSKRVVLTLFILTVVAQWYVPAKMILQREEILSSGAEYKFRSAPIDPNDPFRGKYITLRFKEDRYPVADTRNWRPGEEVYVQLTTGPDGFARIRSVSKEKPTNASDAVKAKVSYIEHGTPKALNLQYPFERFYMEESKAAGAERLYSESLRDTTQVTYALVRVRDGEAVIKDVLIGGTSISELAKRSGMKK